MKKCLKCGRLSIRQSETYCPDCGSREIEIDQADSGGAAVSGNHQSGNVLKGIRILAFAVDFIGLAVLSLFSSIPVLGAIAALAALLYQLLRDYKGASLGKILCRLRVISRTGKEATVQQCILRNVIFIAPFFAFFLPGLGLIAGAPLGILIYAVELILLLASGQRLGDRIAGTTVVRNS